MLEKGCATELLQHLDDTSNMTSSLKQWYFSSTFEKEIPEVRTENSSKGKGK